MEFKSAIRRAYEDKLRWALLMLQFKTALAVAQAAEKLEKV